jgi:hypothetical protein
MKLSVLSALSTLSKGGGSTAEPEEASKSMLDSRIVGAIRPAGIVPEGLIGNRSTAFSRSTVAVETHDAETQTDQRANVIMVENGAQTQEVQIFDVDIPVIMDQGDPECKDASIQTDDVQIYENDVQEKLDLQVVTCDVEAQTDDVHVFEVGVPALLDQQPDRIDGEAQTDLITTSCAGIQTDDARVNSLSKKDAEVDETMVTISVVESGIPGFQAALWAGVLAPAKTPKNIIAQIQLDIKQAMSTPDVKEKMGKMGIEMIHSTPEEFDQHVRSEFIKWSSVAKQANIKTE